MSKDRLFARLAGFLRRNAMLVADATDSNAPWALVAQLDHFEEQKREWKKRKRNSEAKR